MNRLSTQDRACILTRLTEGMGINAACRATGASKNTVLKLLADVGRACAQYQDNAMRNLKCTQVQVDEIWSFTGMKKNVPPDADPELALGDCYTFTAIDPVTRLMPCWLVGFRTADCAEEFMGDLASRLIKRVQLTTDGMSGYPDAVVKAFGRDVGYAVLNKSYQAPQTTTRAARRYSPNQAVGTTIAVENGRSDLKLASTSHVECANLSMRMGTRRFTRLTNTFSKKIENHMHAISFYFMVYNFVKIHSSVKCSPAMASGVTETLWSMEDIVLMTDTAVA